MMLGLGAVGLILRDEGHLTLEAVTAATAVAIFHLFNHAFAKALLFLGAGSVNHATGTFDMRLMGGVRQHMPWTYAAFLIGSVSIAGIWPLSCFWSKDEILVEAFNLSDARVILFYLGMITAFMTAVYMFRAVFMTFHGKYRGGAAGEHGAGHGEHAHLHESPMVMVLPMLLLAGLAIGSGWLNVNGWFSGFFGVEVEHPLSWTHVFRIFTENHYLPLISFVIALLGIDLANAIYSARWISAEAIGRTFSTFYRVFYRKYWMDELYEKVFVVRLLLNTVFRVCQVFDAYVVDGVVNGLAGAAIGAGKFIRNAETGRLQTYGLIMLLGVVVIVGFVYWFT